MESQIKRTAEGKSKINILSSGLKTPKQSRDPHALQDTALIYRTLFDQSPYAIMIFSMDPPETIDFNNRAAERLGYSRDEYKKLNFFTDVIASASEEQAKARLRSITIGQSQKFNAIHRTKSGELLDVEVITKLIDVSGRPMYVTIFRDITEELKRENALIKSHEELTNLVNYIEKAREEERTRAALEIHDEIGSALTRMKIDVSRLMSSISALDEVTAHQLDNLSTSIDGCINSAQHISSMLRPSILDDLGLEASVAWLVKDFMKHSHIECHLRSSHINIKVSRMVATTVFRILQESLTNVARHARASEVNVNLDYTRGHLALKISDNGKGIDMGELHSAKSFGLIGMRQRAKSVGGKLTIKREGQRGTTVKLMIPGETGA
jgi:PAS domain S-box-containing protein